MGEFEQLVLLAILHRDNHAYGMEIREEIEARTGRDVSYGAVYTTLRRLDAKGWVAHQLGVSTPERGGRARKCFRVEAEGRVALRATREALSTMWSGVTI